MEFFWHPEAVAEADAAADFYHNKQRELSRRFINHLDEALDRIAIKPAIYREVEPVSWSTESFGSQSRS
jgi:plasmid stabilization system protein ParE